MDNGDQPPEGGTASTDLVRPARGYSWPPFERGNTAAVRHGAYSAALLADGAEQIADELRPNIPGYAESDEATLRPLALVLARIEAVHTWLGEQPHGIFRDGQGRPQPILRELAAWERQALRLADRLGLNIASRAAIGLDVARGEAVRLTVTRLAELADEEERNEIEGRAGS